jgi:hypothetical protein
MVSNGETPHVGDAQGGISVSSGGQLDFSAQLQDVQTAIVAQLQQVQTTIVEAMLQQAVFSNGTDARVRSKPQGRSYGVNDVRIGFEASERQDGSEQPQRTATNEFVAPMTLGHPESIGGELVGDDDGVAFKVQDKDSKKRIKYQEPSSMASVFMNDEDVEKPVYHVEDLYKKSGWAVTLAKSDTFSNVTAGVVCLNAIWIGIEADWNTAQNLYDAEIVFQVFSQIFCVYFTAELLIRLMAFRRGRDAFRDGWFQFDFFLVSTMIMDMWMLMPMLKIVSGGKGGVQVPTQPLRVLRLLKLSRMARMMKAFPELVTMIKGLVRSLRAIFSSIVLIMLMLYTWSIVLYMLMQDEDDLNEKFRADSDMNFSSVGNTMWILLLDGAFMLDNAAPLLTELIFSRKWNVLLAGIFFLTFALLSSLLILQMLIGVLCDVVAKVNEEQRQAETVGMVKQELLGKLQEVDDGDGKISHEELTRVMNDPTSRAVLKKLGINRLFLMQLQAMLYPTPGSVVPIKSALELLVLCKSDNPVTIETLAGGFCYVFRELELIRSEILTHLQEEEEGIASLTKQVRPIRHEELELRHHHHHTSPSLRSKTFGSQESYESKVTTV